MSIDGQRMDYDPDENERAVLDVVRVERRVNPMRLRDRTGIRKQYVNDALRQLVKLGVVEKVNRGLYQYVPEEDDLPGAPTSTDETRREAKRHVEAARAAAERGEMEELRRQLDAAEEVLDA